MGRHVNSLQAARNAILRAVPEARVAIHAGDAMKESDMTAAVGSACLHGGALHIVVATVGGGGTYCSTIELDADTFMATVEANLRPPFLAIRSGAPAMREGGAFVFISSCAARMPVPHIAGYAAGKAGLDQFVRCTAIELGPRRIRLNTLRPGLTRTNATLPAFADSATVTAFTQYTPLGRLGEAVDTAGAVRFLAGPESSWITGQSFAVDGGNELRGACPLDFELGNVSVKD
jgi:NAD(P)-dependent dehydrogenase (short-subunit alcohol dehydrogenase family)